MIFLEQLNSQEYIRLTYTTSSRSECPSCIFSMKRKIQGLPNMALKTKTKILLLYPSKAFSLLLCTLSCHAKRKRKLTFFFSLSLFFSFSCGQEFIYLCFLLLFNCGHEFISLSFFLSLSNRRPLFGGTELLPTTT